ncbi:MAG: signal peptidase II [Acidimicrobiales bacterium]
MTPRQWYRFTALALTVGAVDLASKMWASRALRQRPMDLPGPLDLRLGYNRGIAFSFLTDIPVAVIVILTSLVAVALAVAAARGSAPLLPAGLILGGALGNLVDRTHNGSVVDMLHTSFWPTFNLADVAICTGAALWVLQSSRRSPRAKESNSTTAPLTSSDSHM